MKTPVGCAFVALAELRAIDVMEADPLGVAEHDSLGAAWEVLARSGCGFVPVVREGRVVGVIDDRALVIAGGRRTTSGTKRMAADCARPATCVAPSTPLAEVVASVRRAPSPVTFVVDDDGRPLGMITTRQLVALLDAAMASSAHQH